MTTKGLTLADIAIRESLRPHSLAVPARIGKKIASARKFVLDKEASSFLSDLAHASYTDLITEKMNSDPDWEAKVITGEMQPPSQEACAIAEKTRHLARLPHATTWIEYDPRAFKIRTDECYDVRHARPERDPMTGKMHIRMDKTSCDVEDVIKYMGWLLEECNDTFVLTMVVGDDNPRPRCIVLPCAFAWTVDDSIPAFKKVTPPDNPPDSAVATGLYDYDIPQVVIGCVPEMVKIVTAESTSRSLAEWMGELRFVWALLACVNDIPVTVRQVKPSKGYVARGRYRSFVEHSIISINIPKQTDSAKFAAKVVAMSRRRRHLVRGHWRRDYRDAEHRIWVHEHERGDASLGFVLHDYSIEHKTGGKREEDRV